MTEPATILHLVSVDGDWETSVHVATLAAALREYGMKSVITAHDHSRLWELAEATGVEVADVVLEKSINPLRWLETGKALKELAPQIIHVHDAEAAKALGRAGMFAAMPKVVASRQNLFPPPAASEFGAAVARLICPSEALAETYRSLKAPEEKIRVIADGVSLPAADNADHERGGLRNQFRDAHCPGKEKPLFLVNIAPLEPDSGQGEIIEAMNDVVAALPQAHLFIMGEGSLHEELRRRIKVTALASDVTILEPDKAFHRLLGAADLYVSNSANDISGYMVQTAMMAGRGVALSRGGCYPELADHGRTAVFAEAPGAEGLKNAMMELLENRNKRESVGKQARAKAIKDFNIAEQAGKVAKVYRELL